MILQLLSPFHDFWSYRWRPHSAHLDQAGDKVQALSTSGGLPARLSLRRFASADPASWSSSCLACVRRVLAHWNWSFLTRCSTARRWNRLNWCLHHHGGCLPFCLTRYTSQAEMMYDAVLGSAASPQNGLRCCSGPRPGMHRLGIHHLKCFLQMQRNEVLDSLGRRHRRSKDSPRCDAMTCWLCLLDSWSLTDMLETIVVVPEDARTS